MDGLDELGDRQFIHSALRGDLELVTRYGEEHPETWAGVWFENEPAVRIVAAFTGDTAQHDAALRPRLRYPDRLLVREQPHSLSDLQRVRQEIERSLRQRAAETGRSIISSVGLRKAVVHVVLRADQEDVAGELAARYGNAVELAVGAFRFPGRRPRYPRDPRSPGRPAPQELAIDGLAVNVEVGQAVLEVGDNGHGRFVLRNNGQQRIGPLDSGQPLVGSLLNESHETVGCYTGWIAGTGRTIDLAPGQSASLGVTFGTASARAELGYTLPPGRYWLKVQMHVHRGPGRPDHVITAPLTPITITPRPHPHPDATP